MRVRQLHGWDLEPRQAVALQRRLAAEVVAAGAPARVRWVAAGDVSYDRARDLTVAAVALFTSPQLALVEEHLAHGRIPFPYIPGLLSFREAPLLLECFGRLRRRPDLLLLDGHGRAHPRRFGLACHVGLILDLPTIGCAKRLLVGRHRPPGARRGDWTPVLHGQEVIGAAVTTRPGTRPIFVSVGHRIDLREAVRLALGLCTRAKYPEPLRHVDRRVGEWRREVLASGWPPARSGSRQPPRTPAR